LLSDNHKQVIILKYIHDMKDAEIAEALGIKIGTVKSRIYRAKLKLKDTMGHLADVKEREDV